MQRKLINQVEEYNFISEGIKELGRMVGNIKEIYEPENNREESIREEFLKTYIQLKLI